MSHVVPQWNYNGNTNRLLTQNITNIPKSNITKTGEGTPPTPTQTGTIIVVSVSGSPTTLVPHIRQDH